MNRVTTSQDGVLSFSSSTIMHHDRGAWCATACAFCCFCAFVCLFCERSCAACFYRTSSALIAVQHRLQGTLKANTFLILFFSGLQTQRFARRLIQKILCFSLTCFCSPSFSGLLEAVETTFKERRGEKGFLEFMYHHHDGPRSTQSSVFL